MATVEGGPYQQRRPLLMDPKDRDRILAYLDAGSFKEAAARLGCCPETVSRSWHAWRRRILRSLEAQRE